MDFEKYLSIDSLETEDIQQAHAFLKETLQEEYESLDLREGTVWNDLHLYISALFHALNNKNIQMAMQSSSLLSIAQNPELADDEIVDRVLSNYLIQRDAGELSSGLVSIAVARDETSIIREGTEFSVGDLIFVTENTYVGVVTDAAVIRENERKLIEKIDGTFQFSIPVVAVEIGEQYNIGKGTPLLVSPAPSGLIQATAASDFSGGRISQTNRDLINRMQVGITSKVMSSRQQIRALIQTLFPQTLSLSVIGFGDSEMLRDRHNIFKISHGGKADIYVQTAQYPIQQELELTAVKIATNSDVWQVSITKDDAPAAYWVDYIRRTDQPGITGTLTISTQNRTIDVEDEEVYPEIENITEGAYTVYQNILITFRDPQTINIVPAGTETTYLVGVSSMPNITELQSLVNNRSLRNPHADYLIRAAIPFEVSVTLNVKYLSGSIIPSESVIKQAVVNQVNKKAFTGRELEASEIIYAVSQVIGSSAYVASPVELLGKLYSPTGSEYIYRTFSALEIPLIPAECISSRTAAFFTREANVSVNFEMVEGAVA